MRKSKGFGRKREMLTGEMAQTLSFPARVPWFARSSSDAREAAIIGGGIASALLSPALLRRGWQVTLYCADEAPAQGASGNRRGRAVSAVKSARSGAGTLFSGRLYLRPPNV